MTRRTISRSIVFRRLIVLLLLLPPPLLLLCGSVR
jgi:hypothetical protein